MSGLLAAGFKALELVGDVISPTKKAEAKAKLMEMEQNGELREHELDVQDRKSARDLATARGTEIQAILSFLIVIGFFGTLGWAISGRIPASVDNMYVGALLGTLGTMTVQVINFWFGSSKGSAMKNELLTKASQ